MSFFEKIFKKDHVSSAPSKLQSNEEFVKSFPDSERLLKSYIHFKECIKEELENNRDTIALISDAKDDLLQRFDDLSFEQKDIETKELVLRLTITLKKIDALYQVTENILNGICPVANQICKDLLNKHVEQLKE